MTVHQPIAAILAILAASVAAQQPSALDRFPKDGPLVLHEQVVEGLGAKVLGGVFEVAEDPAAPAGRHIRLNVVVIPAKAAQPLPDPVFVLAGGPGQAATTLAAQLVFSWMHNQRDIVLIDQRGTGRSNGLQVPVPGGEDDVQGYLSSHFREDVFKRALVELQKVADLTKYTTPIAVDDFDAVRAALHYDQVNLIGGSYGTRAALVYMRRHGEHVRCAVLDGVAPIAFKNPLYHAKAAQEAFEVLRQEVLDDPKLREAYGDLGDTLTKVLKELEAKPAEVEVDIGHDKEAKVQLTRDSFAEALRQMLYVVAQNREVPRLLRAAVAGNLRPFAQMALQRSRDLHGALAYGLLLSVTNAEDLPRITEAEIERETAGTFLRDVRVRGQLAIGRFWPRGEVPDADQPVCVDTPVLLLSGTHDPVTPPRWGAEAASHLPHSLHVVVGGCHGVQGFPRVAKLIAAFLDKAAVEGLDLEGLDKVHMPKIRLPKAEEAAPDAPKKKAG